MLIDYKRFADQESQEDIYIVKGDSWYEIKNSKGDKNE